MENTFFSYQDYLESPEWKILSRLARERDEYRCSICNSDDQLNVHHRVYLYELGTEPLNDLITLCSGCHSLFHENKNTDNSSSDCYQKCTLCSENITDIFSFSGEPEKIFCKRCYEWKNEMSEMIDYE